MYAQKTVYSLNISHKAFRATGADEAPRATRKCAGNMTKDFFPRVSLHGTGFPVILYPENDCKRKKF